MKAYENYKKYSHAACILIYSHALSTKSMEDCIKSKFKAKSKIILKMLSIKTEILIKMWESFTFNLYFK